MEGVVIKEDEESMKNNELDLSEVMFLDETLIWLQKNFKFDSNELKELVLKSLCEKLVKRIRKKGESEIHLKDIDIETINEYKSIEIHRKKFEEYRKWFFGIHSKKKETSILFGFLYMDLTYGLLMINDLFHNMLVIITNNDTNVEFTESCYVIMEDYKIFTEIFNNSEIPNLEYFLVDFKDIIVHTLERKKCLFGKIPPNQKFAFAEEFILHKKSTICLRAGDNTTETYLETGNKSGQKVFLILGSAYTEIILHLKVGFEYRIFYNNILKKENIRILKSAGNFEQFRLFETKAYIQELGNAFVYDVNKILPISDYKKYANSGSVSFEAVLDSRWFVENKYPEFAKSNKLYGFSTPGSEVHVVSFLGDSKITMYLSSWINRLMPFGLIPEMRVIIRNVVSKYTFIQTTIFTYIDIIGYEPKVQFQTVNLYLHHEYDWGTSYYLSKGNDIPTGVIIWSRICELTITDVKMTNWCKICRIMIEAAGPCKDCGSQERDTKFNLIMYSKDLYGKSKIIATDINVLKFVLDLPDKLFYTCLENFINTGEFSFNSFESDSSQHEHIKNSIPVGSLFSLLLMAFNKNLDNNLEIKQHMLMTTDVQLKTAHTPFGTVDFVQIVGICAEELKAAQQWNGAGILDMITRIPSAGGPWHLTDMRRGESIFELDLNAHEEVERGFELEGSNLSGVSARCSWIEQDSSKINIEQLKDVSDDHNDDFRMKSYFQQGNRCVTESAELIHIKKLEAVHLVFNLEAGSLLPLAIRGRVKHGRHFTFKSVLGETAITLVAHSVTGTLVESEYPFVAQSSWLQVLISDDLAQDMAITFQVLANPEALSLPKTFSWPEKQLSITIVADKI